MPRTLADFIREELATVEEGPCVMLSLVCPHDNDREVKSIRITGESDKSPEERAQTFMDLATEDAQETDAISVRYSVRSFFEHRGGEYSRKFTLRVKGNKDSEQIEDASLEGERMQRMRHREDTHDAIIRMSGITFAALGRHAENMQRAMHEERQQNVELFTGMKELIMAKALDTHNYRMAEKRYERWTGVANKFIDLLPPAAKMLGMPVPESTEDTSLVNNMIDEIDANDEAAVSALKLLIGKLQPTTAMLLMSRFDRRAKEVATQKAKERKEKQEMEREVAQEAEEAQEVTPSGIAERVNGKTRH